MISVNFAKSFTSVVCTGVSLAKIHKWSRLQFLMLECESWFETVHTRSTNENNICLCRKGIYELMNNNGPDLINSAGILAIHFFMMGVCLQI